jgi:hypothetical protein
MKQAASLLFVLGAVSATTADVAFSNFGPADEYHGNGWILYGPNTSPVWTHAFQFTAGASGEVTSITVPMQHLSGATNQYQFEMWNDAGGSPGATLGTLGTLTGFINNSPPLPPPVQMAAAPGVSLVSGTTYWLLGRGVGDAQGTWHWNSLDQQGLRAYSINNGPWTTASVTVAAMRIEVTGTGGCYPNCDQSTAAPILNVQDFTCFLQRYAAGESYANCDESTAVPVLNVQDFTCFLQRYAAGCP